MGTKRDKFSGRYDTLGRRIMESGNRDDFAELRDLLVSDAHELQNEFQREKESAADALKYGDLQRYKTNLMNAAKIEHAFDKYTFLMNQLPGAQRDGGMEGWISAYGNFRKETRIDASERGEKRINISQVYKDKGVGGKHLQSALEEIKGEFLKQHKMWKNSSEAYAKAMENISVDPNIDFASMDRKPRPLPMDATAEEQRKIWRENLDILYPSYDLTVGEETYTFYDINGVGFNPELNEQFNAEDKQRAKSDPNREENIYDAEEEQRAKSDPNEEDNTYDEEEASKRKENISDKLNDSFNSRFNNPDGHLGRRMVDNFGNFRQMLKDKAKESLRAKKDGVKEGYRIAREEGAEGVLTRFIDRMERGQAKLEEEKKAKRGEKAAKRELKRERKRQKRREKGGGLVTRIFNRASGGQDFSDGYDTGMTKQEKFLQFYNDNVYDRVAGMVDNLADRLGVSKYGNFRVVARPHLGPFALNMGKGGLNSVTMALNRVSLRTWDRHRGIHIEPSYVNLPGFMDYRGRQSRGGRRGKR